MRGTTVAQVVSLLVSATLIGCSPVRPDDGELAVAPAGTDLVCVDRLQGYVTPPATGCPYQKPHPHGSGSRSRVPMTGDPCPA